MDEWDREVSGVYKEEEEEVDTEREGHLCLHC